MKITLDVKATSLIRNNASSPDLQSIANTPTKCLNLKHRKRFLYNIYIDYASNILLMFYLFRYLPGLQKIDSSWKYSQSVGGFQSYSL